MKQTIACFLLSGILYMTACNDAGTPEEKKSETTAYEAGSFGYDVQFLKQHDSIIVLENGDAQVIVSPKYQAKVFTSSANGMNGKSFGWINYKAFTAPVDAHMNAYGGENRIWLGPEGGKFSLFFPKDSSMVFDNWKTPAAIDTEAWDVTAKDAKSVTMRKDMQITNYAGTPLSIGAERAVSILSTQDIAQKIGVNFDTSVKVTGYQTVNTITNSGKEAWTEKTGMPCIWILDMFNPSPKVVIAVPYKTAVADAKSKVATTDYFGEIPAGRIKYENGVLLFKADGKSRGKLGIGPARALPAAGSYDAQNQVLTITLFDVDSSGRYLNQEWNTKKPSFSGDAVNAYNDGPLQDGSQMGPFYEIESVSPAAFLQPGQSLTHKHAVFHFTGNEQVLDAISQKVLQISLTAMKTAF
jgi:hypothetical protein